jgi:hypothetical protein
LRSDISTPPVRHVERALAAQAIVFHLQAVAPLSKGIVLLCRQSATYCRDGLRLSHRGTQFAETSLGIGTAELQGVPGIEGFHHKRC